MASSADRDLRHVELAADPLNTASHPVIVANGDVHYRKEAAYGGSEALRFSIMLNPMSAG